MIPQSRPTTDLIEYLCAQVASSLHKDELYQAVLVQMGRDGIRVNGKIFDSAFRTLEEQEALKRTYVIGVYLKIIKGK